MSAALTAVLPAVDAVRQDRGVLPYIGLDMHAHRNALGLQLNDLVPLLGVSTKHQRLREDDSDDELDVPDFLVEELLDMAEFVEEETAVLIADATSRVCAGRLVRLVAVADQAEFVSKYPEEKTLLRNKSPYPPVVQHVAVGRATAELIRRGYDVEVYRGGQRADLTVRRLAAGLGKTQAAGLLGIEEKRYYRMERGQRPAPPGVLADLQELDDFITTVAAALPVTGAGDDVSVVWLIDDQFEFEQAYPAARTRRDHTPYPVRVLRVAAARRAAQIMAAGADVRLRLAVN